MRSISFTLASIHTEQFATIDKPIPTETESKVDFGLQIAFGLNSDERFVACFLDVTYKLEGKLIIILKTRTEFLIDEKSWQSLFSNDKIVLPKGFMLHLGVISVGTARGILHAKTEHTPYNQFILPTVNLEEIIKEDEVFEPKVSK